MSLSGFSLAWLAIVAWLIMRAVHQRGLLPHLAATVPLSLPEAPILSVVIPARDEAGNIARCLDSLLAQNYPARRLNLSSSPSRSALS